MSATKSSPTPPSSSPSSSSHSSSPLPPRADPRENYDVSLVGDILTIRINVKGGGRPTGTGKNISVASTGGNRPIAGTALKLGFNLYREPALAAPSHTVGELPTG